MSDEGPEMLLLVVEQSDNYPTCTESPQLLLLIKSGSVVSQTKAPTQNFTFL